MDQVSEYMVKVVRDAAKKLDSLGIGSLLVKKDGDYVGMVSETEITRLSVARNHVPRYCHNEGEKTPLPYSQGWKNRGGNFFGKRPAGLL